MVQETGRATDGRSLGPQIITWTRNRLLDVRVSRGRTCYSSGCRPDQCRPAQASLADTNNARVHPFPLVLPTPWEPKFTQSPLSITRGHLGQEEVGDEIGKTQAHKKRLRWAVLSMFAAHGVVPGPAASASPGTCHKSGLSGLLYQNLCFKKIPR